MTLAATSLTVRELDRTPDLVELAGAARDAGHEVLLIERPMPDAVSVAGIGTAYEIVSSPGGVALEDAGGEVLDREAGHDRVQAAARMWRRLRDTLHADGAGALPPGAGPIAIGGFAYRTDRDPSGPWSGFPSLLLRVPALAGAPVRGRTFITCATPQAEHLPHFQPSATRAPPPRTPDRTPGRKPLARGPAIR